LNTERKITLAVLLAIVSIIAIQPSIVHATSLSVTVIAQGSASSTVDSAISASARIYLIGTADQNGGDIQLSHLTGILQIGPVFYTITEGQGQTNYQTDTVQVNLQVGGSNPGALTLGGTYQIASDKGLAVLFTPQQSNMESQYSLWLHGNLWMTPAPYS
jgi:hypothetical protein